MTELPIEPLLPQICDALKTQTRLVLAAPPGAGKTTRVPLALAGLLPGFTSLPGKVVLLEPRRIAARMAAERMASTLGERVGDRIGLSTRVDRKVSAQTLVEVITDGLLIRRLLSDPELAGVSAVLFDEVHERGLNTDLGLALCLEIQQALRDDLCIMAMSATLETDRFAQKLKAQTLEASGRQYPVETRYLGRTRDRVEDQMARAIERALRETDGSILAFLPGAGEIRRTAERLIVPPDTLITPLYGALSPQDQDAAISPCPAGRRKIVLSTDIAESALTIDGVSVVVDAGLSRIPDGSDPLTTRLMTVRASRASADQRRGRAGRLGPGICYRLWDEAETRGLVADPQPEILNTDLSGLVLTLAEWGERDPLRLSWLDPPPVGRLEQARETLRNLGAIDGSLTLTDKGREMAKLPLTPRLSALIVSARQPNEKAVAARIAALMGERGIGGASDDLSERLSRFERDTSSRAKTLLKQAIDWGGGARADANPADVLARAWPDRLARRRDQDSANYLLASGRAGQVSVDSPLGKSEWLVVAEMLGSARTARITLAAPLDERAAIAAGRLETREDVHFEPEKKSFRARKITALGAIILAEQPLPRPSGQAARAAFLSHLKEAGFGPCGYASIVLEFVRKLELLRANFEEDWPVTSVQTLQDSVEDWLGAFLPQRDFSVPSEAKLRDALHSMLGWQLGTRFQKLAPNSLELPTGRQARIDWLDERAPLIDCKVQELYGTATHPSIAEGRLPVTLQMLSPGGKPVATTRDLLGFWTGGYADMVKDMRGRYPKHDWPDTPATAKPHQGMTKARLKDRGI